MTDPIIPVSLPPPLPCPGCGAPMISETTHSLDLDRCPRCHGLWFDHPELETYIRRERGSGSQPPIDLVRLPEAGRLSCPRCAEQTLESWRAGTIFLSRCRRCLGVYADQADLSAIRGQRPVYGTPAPLGSGGVVPEWIEVPVEVICEVVVSAVLGWT